jgi:hypothetical protein
LSRTTVSGEQEPRLFLLRLAIEELELGIRDPTTVGTHRNRQGMGSLASLAIETLSSIPEEVREIQ